MFGGPGRIPIKTVFGGCFVLGRITVILVFVNLRTSTFVLVFFLCFEHGSICHLYCTSAPHRSLRKMQLTEVRMYSQNIALLAARGYTMVRTNGRARSRPQSEIQGLPTKFHRYHKHRRFRRSHEYRRTPSKIMAGAFTSPPLMKNVLKSSTSYNFGLRVL